MALTHMSHQFRVGMCWFASCSRRSASDGPIIFFGIFDLDDFSFTSSFHHFKGLLVFSSSLLISELSGTVGFHHTLSSILSSLTSMSPLSTLGHKSPPWLNSDSFVMFGLIGFPLCLLAMVERPAHEKDARLQLLDKASPKHREDIDLFLASSKCAHPSDDSR